MFKLNRGRIVEWAKRNKVTLKMIATILIYGALTNYAIAFIFGWPFSVLTIPAYGIAWHFIKEEIPMVVNRYRAPRSGGIR